MTDYYNGNHNNNGRSRERRLEDIFADVDARYDYDGSYDFDDAADRSRTSSGRSSGGSSSQSQSRTGTSQGASSGRTRSQSGTQRSRSSAASSRSSSTRTGSARTSSARQSTVRSQPARSRDPEYDSERRTKSSSSAARRPASSAARARVSQNKKRKRRFRKYLLIYIAVLVVILIIGSIIFSSYLASYENAQPSHAAELVVNAYQSQEGIISLLTTYADKTGAADSISDIANSYATNIAGKTISYRENNDFRPDNPAYDITADGSICAKVAFVPASGSDAYQNSKWAIQSLNVLDYMPNALTITVDAPAGATVSVNGRVYDASYIESTGVPAILENSLKFLKEPPEFNTYRISGLLSEPEVVVTDANGTSLTVTKSENSYSASPAADQAFIDSVEDRVYDAIDNYATYFIHMSFELANYIVYDSDLYSYIFGSDTMDPIATALYMFEDIESYDFTERSAGNFVKYADDCFTVDIKYALDMRFTDPTYEDNNQNMDATWVFVIEPLDGSWCISDIITH